MTTELLFMTTGRVIFGLFFLVAGLRNFAGFADWKTRLTNYGWPLPLAVLAAGFALQVICGLALIFGYGTQAATWTLILFIVLATALFHNLFLFKDKERDPHLYLTLVNITLISGLLMIIGMDQAGL